MTPPKFTEGLSRDLLPTHDAPFPGPTGDQGAPYVPGLVLEGVVAEGGMGLVYAAREISSGKRVALKTLRACFANDEGARARFEREISFTRRVVHPNVAPVLGHGHMSDGRPYYLMELYRGRTLGAVVREDGPLSIGRALEITDRILAGLEAVHAAGIVHRDLTPENVLLTEGPAGETRVLLLDFGFAHEPGVDTGDGVTADSRGALVGTIRFMSPEQVTRGRAITAQSDLFATALLLYYAVSGKLPFRGEGDLDVAVATVRKAPVPLRAELRNVPRALDVLLSRALAKHPDARFSGAAEMRRALSEMRRPRAKVAGVAAALAG
ncbi:serine/threonine-protein kinase [Polyangium jinanense]|uniref:Serine/threonine protein kinase n=1 Tax=Polyangium jinanense TaxID=2829994 RepID=A0A9X3XET8_9BACT|nr:serine/threonine-protein kinase [Polyangium jinanense]MDC3957169.1 serine/threonine protein kinase [Polyangium jinanense]MDC3986801.1 serine/threonine protein kinase [Polyangium jinanense]